MRGQSLPGPDHSLIPLPPGGLTWTHLVCLPHPSIVGDVFPECAEAIHLQAGDRMGERLGCPPLPSPRPGLRCGPAVGMAAHILVISQVPGVVAILVDHAL